MNTEIPKKNPKQLDRGDSVKLTKTKTEDKVLSGDKGIASKQVENCQKNRISTIEGRKELREKYTIKRNTCQNTSVDAVKSDFRNDPLSRKAEKPSDPEKNTQKQREAVIQTFVSKEEDHKTFKTVTFTDKNELTPLQIKIAIPQKISKASDTSTITTNPSTHIRQNETSPKLMKDKTKKVKAQKKKRDNIKSSNAAPKEVVTWEPTSINDYTKPIYEAWVNKTPVALSGQDEELFLDAQTEQTSDPLEIAFDPTDERFTGRIKVRKYLA